ncbi:monooxygenase [Bosea sp. Root381]|uniref:LLM class flavin-dependent oxidoreductase n=1 Tax=Bosea sp. Root381 TaxID=1736524 RepID=UPI0006FE8059|nr:LLM class flavin-dependent oxidoreductase [Bosea sp. Root381]KRE06910.1 monooxygenase [Bosea sp. Root381]
MPAQRQLHLNLNFLNAGTHSAAWLWPDGDPAAFVDPAYYVKVARIAERGTFDAIFLADHPTFPDRSDFRPFQALEPTILLATIAAATEHIGLIATVSSTYNDPFNIARRFATLDQVSGGRAGINIVTTADRSAAFNFGLEQHVAHAQRYERAVEFADVLTALWDSWADDALVGDKTAPVFVDPARVRRIDHRGPHFAVRGPSTVPRSPQGRPLIVQAGGSDDGLELAARHAEAVFTAAHTLDRAKAYAEKLRARTASVGRPADAIRILPGLVTIIGGTEAEAKRREEELWDLAPLEQGVRWIAGLLQVDAARLTLDKPLPDDLTVPTDGMTTFAAEALAKGRRDNLTVRELIRSQGAGGTNHRTVVGSPEQIAETIETWFASGDIAGFNLMPDVLPSGLEAFVDHVVPILRRRGIFRAAYEGRTLRDHFGLPRAERRPASVSPVETPEGRKPELAASA